MTVLLSRREQWDCRARCSISLCEYQQLTHSHREETHRTSSRVWVNNGLDEGVELVKRRVQGQIEGECAFFGASSNRACNLESGSNIILSF